MHIHIDDIGPYIVDLIPVPRSLAIDDFLPHTLVAKILPLRSEVVSAFLFLGQVEEVACQFEHAIGLLQDILSLKTSAHVDIEEAK